MTPRAQAMSPVERREALVEATLPLLRHHGRAVTTRQIAEAAGVAEGTIFRVFDSKDELIEAALARAFLPGTFIRQLDEVDPDAPLRTRLTQVVTLLQARFTEIFGLMRAVGIIAPPDHDSSAHVRARAEIDARLRELLAPDAEQLRVSTAELMHIIRLLTFAGSNHEIADGRLLAPEQIVDIVLDGVLLRPGSGRKGCSPC